MGITGTQVTQYFAVYRRLVDLTYGSVAAL